MNGIATIGGASSGGITPTPASPPSSNFHPSFSAASSVAAAAASSSLTLNLLPSTNYLTSNLLANCARQAQQLRYTRHTRRFLPRYYPPTLLLVANFEIKIFFLFSKILKCTKMLYISRGFFFERNFLLKYKNFVLNGNE